MLFFFLDYEGFRQVLKPLTVLTLPTQNELAGNLVVAVQNPLTGVVYPAGTPIPAAAINPISAGIVKQFQAISQLPAKGRRNYRSRQQRLLHPGAFYRQL